MIRINKDWLVDVDEYNYTLKRDLHSKTKKKNPKTGEIEEVDSYRSMGYYSNLASALNRLCEEMRVSELKDKDITLKEAIKIIEDCTKEWREITKEILEVK